MPSSSPTASQSQQITILTIILIITTATLTSYKSFRQHHHYHYYRNDAFLSLVTIQSFLFPQSLGDRLHGFSRYIPVQSLISTTIPQTSHFQNQKPKIKKSKNQKIP
jgi:hypothetical protein